MLKRIMRKDLVNDKKGFTLAEVLVAVAILIILTGVSFIAVASYLRSMTQLERDGIAKEIFVAAQNHLTMAEEQGFLGVKKEGTPFTDEGNKTYYYIINRGEPADSFEDSMLGLMLPMGAVDETVRKGGNYIIQYQKNPALVLRVYYCASGSSARFPHVFGAKYGEVTEEYNKTFLTQTKTKELRRDFTTDHSVLGYFDREGAASLEPQEIKPPTIKVTNAERLVVEITDPNKVNYESLQLIVKGVTSEKEKVIQVKLGSGASGAVTTKFELVSDTTNASFNKYTLILDDVTTSGRLFADQFEDDGLIPGEDIEIQAVAYSTTMLANIAKSAAHTTNSLFAEISITGEGTVLNTASVENIRHLENLDSAVSRLPTANAKIKISNCEQISDLSWPEFKEVIGGETVSIYTAGTSIAGGTGGYYYPVSPKLALDYKGNKYQVVGIDATSNGDAGMFGELLGGSKVKDIELIDFTIESQGKNAGALAGSAINTEVTNVIAYNSDSYTEKKNITSTGGSAGGLTGSMKGGSVTSCAAALYVENKNGNAGGLIGSVSDFDSSNKGSIAGSYSGGHTVDGQYYTYKNESGVVTNTRTDLYNVKGTGAVGGLVGDAANSAISGSYSTCSVSGSTVGGLIGTSTGGSVTNCYATGMVKGTTKEGAFAGSLGGTVSGENYYYEIINEREATGATAADVIGYEYLKAVGGASGSVDKAGITAFDADTATKTAVQNYNNFTTKDGKTGSAKTNVDAVPYDTVLGNYYQNKYHLRTVAQLPGSAVAAGSYVEKHYGDWPAPEIFVINTAS